MDNIQTYLLLSAFLLSIGLVLIISKRHIIMVLIGIELMLNAANINFVAFSKNSQAKDGQMFVIFILVIAAAEAVTFLAILLTTYRYFKTIQLDQIAEMGDDN